MARIITDLEIGWCGGIIDGEGHIGIYTNTTVSYRLMLKLDMTHKKTLEKFAQIMQSGEVVHSVPRNSKCKDMYTLLWYNDFAIRIIKIIQPVLITKKIQAELAIEFHEKCHLGCGSGRQVPENIRLLRMVIASEMRDLNRKGKHPN